MSVAYWEARPESIDDCAGRLAGFASDIAAIDVRLIGWRRKGSSRAVALTSPIVDLTSPDVCRRVLREGASHCTESQSLGCSVYVWSPGDDPRADAALTIHCGSMVHGCGNAVILEHCGEQLNGLPVLQRLVTILAERWDPAWAGTMSEPVELTMSGSMPTPLLDLALYVREDMALHITGRRASNAIRVAHGHVLT
ncbi:MAG: hypothetical protein KIT68_13525 [Phycisphaeraceae bacterium]|nr:hypothetical protein [Phycisphaeraceae bacterium]